MSIPNVIISLEPEENGNLVYLAAVPLGAGLPSQPYLNFRVRIRNSDATDILLERIIVVLFAQNGSSVTPQIYTFEPDLLIEKNLVRETYITKDQAIPIPHAADTPYTVQLYFSGYDEPIIMAGTATAHSSPTSQGSYRFYGNTDDMRMHEYFIPKRHDEVGSQFFGYDVVVKKWVDNDGYSALKPGTTGDKNEDYFGYGKPLYALADGNVIGVINNVDNNPAPGKRSLMFIDDDEAGHVSALSLVRLNSVQMAMAVRTAHGTLKIIIYGVETPGVDVANSKLVRLGDIEAEESISNVIAISPQDFVLPGGLRWLITAVRLVDGTLKVILWEISSDGISITRLSEDSAGVINQLTAVSLTPTRFVVALITAGGRLKVIVWDIADNGNILIRRGDAEDEGIVRLDVARLRNRKFVTAVQTESNQLKLIAWEVTLDGLLNRLKEATAPGTIADVSAAWVSGPANELSITDTIRIATAVRTSSNRLKITYWDYYQLSGDMLPGDIQPVDVFQVGTARSVKLARVSKKSDDTATCIVTSEGKLQLTVWNYDPGEINQGKIDIMAQNDGGPVDLIDLIWLNDETPYYFITAVRTDQQTLKLTLWFLGSGAGNYVTILHSEEIIFMDHMIKGSINPALLQLGAPVKQGQYVGKLGNSGSSSGPHLHIHASKAEPGKSLEDLIDDKKNNKLIETFRPSPFHYAQAMLLPLAVPGPGVIPNNLFSVVNGDGFYWDHMAVWPGTTTPGIPTGRPGLTRWNVPSGEFQDTFDAITGANYYPIWIDGYTVGTHRFYNMLFRPEPAPLWSAQAGLTSQEYDDLVEERKQEGFRPVFVNSNNIGSHVLYSVIFRKNDGIGWSAYHEKSAEEHQILHDGLVDQGFIPVCVSVVSVNGQRSYTALFERRDVGRVRLKSFLTTDEYQEEFDHQDEKGLQVAFLDAYIYKGSVRYSAIWNEEHSGTTSRARHHLTAPQLQQEYDAAVRDGFVTAVLAGYDFEGQSHFAAIWRK